MSRELARIKKLFGSLNRAPLIKFPPAKGRLVAPDLQGVYVIYSPRGKILHVGRTLRGKKGLRQRLNNHLQAGSSFVIKHLDSKGSKLREGYSFRCLAVKDDRKRALLEFYALAHLCPEHIGLGEAG